MLSTLGHSTCSVCGLCNCGNPLHSIEYRPPNSEAWQVLCPADADLIMQAARIGMKVAETVAKSGGATVTAWGTFDVSTN